MNAETLKSIKRKNNFVTIKLIRWVALKIIRI